MQDGRLTEEDYALPALRQVPQIKLGYSSLNGWWQTRHGTPGIDVGLHPTACRPRKGQLREAAAMFGRMSLDTRGSDLHPSCCSCCTTKFGVQRARGRIGKNEKHQPYIHTTHLRYRQTEARISAPRNDNRAGLHRRDLHLFPALPRTHQSTIQGPNEYRT
ncbi:hypothetical protein FKP32DRAFT_750169 [Trametes sanguinea]|nr:hypothetical protein FKP32DRAFT_750169 [Trametes sanguinea]